MKQSSVKKLVLAAMLAAIAVVGSLFSFPVFGAKCAPVQHFVNIICAIFLGPVWGVMTAFVASLIRNVSGLGTALAFPGSMCGVLLAGILYQYKKKVSFALLGEVFGTAVIGGLLSYPVAVIVLGSKTATLFTFVLPFFISTAGGTLIAALITIPLEKTGVIKKLMIEQSK